MVHAAVDNTFRYQGMWVESLEKLRNNMADPPGLPDDEVEREIGDWIHETCDQEPVLNVEVDCFAMQGDGVTETHDYHSKVRFNNAHSELCQFELKIGLYGFSTALANHVCRKQPGCRQLSNSWQKHTIMIHCRQT